MAEIRREGDIIFVGDKVAIERGPARLTAKATEELLSNNVTADHYQPPRPATPEEIERADILTKGDQRLFLDAAGVPIELGKTMTYLDHLNPEPGFYIMELADRPDYDADKHGEKQIWQERGYVAVKNGDAEAAQLEALNIATNLAGG